MKFSFFLVLMCLPIISGCFREYSKAEWEAGKIFLNYPSDVQCLERARELARRMQENGESCMVVIGKYQGEEHAWVEYKGMILDPSQADTAPSNYTQRHRLEIYNV